jgi:DNA-binding NarL/FixJ family response regulator
MLPGMANAEPPIRVVVVDDHAVVRPGLRLLLGAEPDIEVVGEAGSAQEAVGTQGLLPEEAVI